MNKYIPPPKRIKEWKEQINYCLMHLYLLNKDEQGLIHSCNIAILKKGVISRRQSSWLRNIFYKIT